MLRVPSGPTKPKGSESRKSLPEEWEPSPFEAGSTGILHAGQRISVLGGNQEILVVLTAQFVRFVGLGVHVGKLC